MTELMPKAKSSAQILLEFLFEQVKSVVLNLGRLLARKRDEEPQP